MPVTTLPTYFVERHVRPRGQAQLLNERVAEWDEDAIAREFADEFGVDPDDVEVTDEYDFGVEYWNVEVNRREYLTFADEDEAEQYAIDRVADDLDDQPELFNQDWLEGHIYISDIDRRMIAQEEEANDYAYEVLEGEEAVREANMEDEYDAAMDALDTTRALEIESAAREQIYDAKQDEIERALRDPIQYFVHDRGIWSVEDLMKQSFMQIDTGEAAKDAVRIDGVGHFLAGYDGHENDTDGGLVYFRTN